MTPLIMNRREQILTAAIGFLLVSMGTYWAFTHVQGALFRRANLHRQVSDEIAKKQRVLDRAQQFADKLAVYEEMSLPANVELARSQYQAWLAELLDDVQLSDPQVRVISQTRRANKTVQLTCYVSGRGDLDQLTQLLHNFYQVDTIHRIRRMPIKPIPDSKQLSITLIVEALILPSADPTRDFDSTRPSPFIKIATEQFTQPILDRNMFSPANSRPRIRPIGPQQAEQGKPWAITIQADDPDNWDVLHYSLTEDAPTGAEIDRNSGRLRWTPSQIGQYQLTVVASDDGIPHSQSEQQISVEVVEPTMVPTEIPKPGFDAARFTYAIAAIDVSGRRQLWLQSRSSGEILKLFEGDEVHVGSVHATVTKISQRDAQLQSDGKMLLIRIGQPLISTAAPVDQP